MIYNASIFRHIIQQIIIRKRIFILTMEISRIYNRIMIRIYFSFFIKEINTIINHL